MSFQNSTKAIFVLNGHVPSALFNPLALKAQICDTGTVKTAPLWAIQCTCSYYSYQILNYCFDEVSDSKVDCKNKLHIDKVALEKNHIQALKCKPFVLATESQITWWCKLT